MLDKRHAILQPVLITALLIFFVNGSSLYSIVPYKLWDMSSNLTAWILIRVDNGESNIHMIPTAEWRMSVFSCQVDLRLSFRWAISK